MDAAGRRTSTPGNVRSARWKARWCAADCRGDAASMTDCAADSSDCVVTDSVTPWTMRTNSPPVAGRGERRRVLQHDPTLTVSSSSTRVHLRAAHVYLTMINKHTRTDIYCNTTSLIRLVTYK